jgi:hypothetical protein
MAIQSMTRSVVNWINSGFNGSPAFVTNLDVYLGLVADATANTFVNQLLADPAIKSPFQTAVATLVQVNYLRSSAANGFFLQNPYTLSQYTTNDTAFINGQSFDGGLRAWLAMTTNPQNNPLGSQLLAQNELTRRISQAQANKMSLLNWGQGFLSWCETDNAASAPEVTGCEGPGCAPPVNTTLANGAKTCTNSDGSAGTISTPGSVIQAQLNKTLGLSGDQLVTADEFNEIIGALMSQLVGQVLGGGGGLAGVSQPSSSGASFLTQATDASQLNGQSDALGSAFVNGIESSKQQVTQYMTAWQSIGSQADAAIARGGSCADTATQPDDVKAQADAAQAKGSAALAKLDTFATQAQSAAASGSVSSSQVGTAATQGTSLQAVGTAYQSFIASSAMPSASDITYASQQNIDTGTSTPASLYSQMVHVADGCPS